MTQTAKVQFSNTPLPPANPGESFDPAAGYDRLRKITGDCLRPGGLNLTKYCLGKCGLAPGSRILDLGCGPGASLRLLRELGFDVLGLDISQSLTGEAAKHGVVLRGDLARIPLVDDCLDGVLCECALSPARDKTWMLTQCRRKLKKGGLLMLSDITVTSCSEPDASPRIERAERVSKEDKIGRHDIFSTGPLHAAGRHPGKAATGLAGQGSPPCASGALSPDGWVDLVRENGFSILLVEDHSHELRLLTARLVWEYGSSKILADFWPERSPPDVDRANRPACGPGLKKTGYMLIVGQKNN